MGIPEQVDQGNSFKQILQQTFSEKLFNGIIGDSILPQLLEVMEWGQEIVTGLEDSGLTPSVSCRKGCSYCCHSKISIIPVEALLIRSFVKKEFSLDEQKSLNQRIASRQKTAGDTTQIGQQALTGRPPCIFLDGDACRIYPVRPFICRAWNSLDAAGCESAFYSKDQGAEIESSCARNHVFGSARDLFLDLGRMLSLESSPLELSRAVSRCLALTDPMILWLGGETIFSLRPPGTAIPARENQPDKRGRALSEPGKGTTREQDYLDYFYGKHRGRAALGVGYNQNLSEIFPFIFQNIHGTPIGMVAMGAVSSSRTAVHIYHIGSFETRCGDGTRILGELCRKADCFNIHLSVSPVFMPNGQDPHMDYQQLSEWYERFGFKGDANLVRSPRKELSEEDRP